MFDINLFKHKIRIKVRFSDLDAMRHVNNATYLSYIEEARIAYFNDVLNRPMTTLDFGAVVARIEIDYIKPIMLGDEIEIYTRVSRIGNKSSDVENLMLVEKDNAKIVVAEALTKLVSYDYKKLVSKPISEEIKKKIQSFEKLI